MEQPASQGICGGGYDDGITDGTDDGTTDGTDDGTTDGTDDGTDDGTADTCETMIICHFPSSDKHNPQTLEISVSAWPAHQRNGAREGTCESDADGDTIPNSQDLCPNTYMPEGVPRQYMLFRRFALTTDSPIFRKGPRKKIGQYTLLDTRGCSCEQLVDVAENKKPYHFEQFPRLYRQVRSLFPFYTRGAREYGCGKAIVNMVKNFE